MNLLTAKPGKGKKDQTPHHESLVYTGEQTARKVRISIFTYDRDSYHEKIAKNMKECLSFIKKKKGVKWINVDGLHKVDVIRQLGEYFHLHSILMEDILNTEERPKLDDYDDHLFIILKALKQDRKSKDIEDHHISLVLGKDYVISFQEKEGTIFERVRYNIRNNRGRLRKMPADYLAYALIDSVVDSYFSILERLEDDIDKLEDEVVKRPKTSTLQSIQDLKGEVISLRKYIWPLRDVVSRLERADSDLIRPRTLIYLRDVYDHIVQLIENIESHRETLAALLDIYLSSIANKTNEVMKLLTIIATIFIPLTFITGLYGMNFRMMPELEWEYGYPAVLTLMLAVAGLMLVYFHKKGWI